MKANLEVAPTDLINISDELSRVKAYLECVYLAAEGELERESENAILSVLIVAQDKLKDVIQRVDALYTEPKKEAA